MLDSDGPLVAVACLPDHHHQAPGRAQCPPDVGERSTGIVEEHRAEPADGQVEALWRKAVDLCVGVLKGGVAQALGLGELTGALDGGGGDVDPKRAACLRGARGLPGRLPGPAADVKDVILGLHASGPAQHLVVPAQFSVVAGTAGCLFAGGVSHRSPFAVAGVASAVLVTGVHH